MYEQHTVGWKENNEKESYMFITGRMKLHPQD